MSGGWGGKFGEGKGKVRTSDRYPGGSTLVRSNMKTHTDAQGRLREVWSYDTMLFYYDEENDLAILNNTKYSHTTTNHQSFAYGNSSAFVNRILVTGVRMGADAEDLKTAAIETQLKADHK